MDILCTLGNLHHCLALVECKTVKQRIDNYMYNIHNQTKFPVFFHLSVLSISRYNS